MDNVDFHYTNAKVADIISFGNFPQKTGGDTTGKERIAWYVLARSETEMLVISKYALYCMPYNEKQKNTSWETSSVRRWLNSVFYECAFSAEEKKIIQTVNISSGDSLGDAFSCYSPTSDNVFLLDAREARRFMPEHIDSMCAPTEYAIAQGAFFDEDFTVDKKPACTWWLRSVDAISHVTPYVNCEGFVYNCAPAGETTICVRPALVLSSRISK